MEQLRMRGRYTKLIWLVIALVLVGWKLVPNRVAGTDGIIHTWQPVTLPVLPSEFASMPVLRESPSSAGVKVQAAVLVDGETGMLLYSDNGQRPVPIASTTKIMTAIVVRRLLPIDQVVEITKQDATVIGSAIGMYPGERLTVRSLLAGLLIVSGNDAAQTLARVAGGSQEAFVAMMNKTAEEFGMNDTHYLDPAGLDDTGRSTAYDLAIASRALLDDPVLAELVRTSETTVYSTDGNIRHDFKNSNRLVGEFDYLGAIGLKTGYTPDAGHCLVGAAERDGHQLIAVILHTNEETIQASAIEARKLLDWGWQNVTWKPNPLDSQAARN